MEIELRVLYNLLRMNWLKDPNLSVEPWKVDDYRSMGIEHLFQKLKACGFVLDKNNFLAFAESIDTPEDLTERLLEDFDDDSIEKDRIYLLVFELWRRLLPEKLCLSVFCDELDHQIFLYDQGDAAGAESIQDAMTRLQMILDENVDQGGKSTEVFETVSSFCANDLESFLYDYIAEQIDNKNIFYSSELLDGFKEYLKTSKWFDLLKVRLLEFSDPEEAQEQLRKLVQKAAKENDMLFNLEVLSFIVQSGEKGEFKKMVKKTVPLLENEEDFQDLLTICGDYFRCLDEDQKEQTILSILEKRLEKPAEVAIDQHDPDVIALLKSIK
ncbi:MAG: hypothetical protein WB791_01830 [Waddliaceae bacterium]